MQAPSAGPEIPQILVAAAALATVLLLIWGLSWLARRTPALFAAQQANDAGPLLRGTLRLDTRRCLHLVEAHGRHALILTGGVTDVIALLPPPAA